jgi:hypothetical protein
MVRLNIASSPVMTLGAMNLSVFKLFKFTGFQSIIIKNSKSLVT